MGNTAATVAPDAIWRRKVQNGTMKTYTKLMDGTASVQRQRVEAGCPAQRQQDPVPATAGGAAALASQGLRQMANTAPRALQLKRQAEELAGGPAASKLRHFQQMANLAPRTLQLKQTVDNVQRGGEADRAGLPERLKSGIEALSGMSMDHVRVHYNSQQPAQLQAHAYAQGSDIHVGPGQERHLPHEAWHIVQQMQGRVAPTRQLHGRTPVNDDAGLESEADVMGARALLHGGQAHGNEAGSLQPPGSLPAVQRVIKAGERAAIQALSRQNVLARMRHPGPHEEAGEIATAWLKTNGNPESSELSQWMALINEHLRPQRGEVVREEEKGQEDSDGMQDDEEGMEGDATHEEEEEYEEEYEEEEEEDDDAADEDYVEEAEAEEEDDEEYAADEDDEEEEEDEEEDDEDDDEEEDEEEDKEEDDEDDEDEDEEDEQKRQEAPLRPVKVRAARANALWEKEAEILVTTHATLKKIAVKKIALILMLSRHGIFNAMGRGANPRYIRSDRNAVIKMTVQKLPQEKNKRGEIPDVYQNITPNEWLAVMEALNPDAQLSIGKSKDIDEHIRKQRSISGEIHMTTFPEPQENEPPLMTLIFDGNYPALNIHFPALESYIRNKQEISSKKKAVVGAGQGKGMTKFLMGRLMFLCNSGIADASLKLVEKSSFGFQTPTLGDLGTNMTIRLSPGIDRSIVDPVKLGLQKLHEELSDLMNDKSVHSLDTLNEHSKIYEYWKPGKKGPTQDVLLESYNTKKTKLNHLLFTQVERGTKGNTLIGRMFERNHKNILALAGQEKSLLEWATEILTLHRPDKLNAALKGKKLTLGAPDLLPADALNAIETNVAGDEVAGQRLALFQSVARAMKCSDERMEEDAGLDRWDEEASDSELEDSDGESGQTVSGGKAVVPSGMASLSQMLGDEAVTKTERVKSRMQPGLYYEDFDHAKKNFSLAGYTTADLIVADLNPNRAQPGTDAQGQGSKVEGVVRTLNESNAKVWMVDMTSSTQEEQSEVYGSWKKNAAAQLLITLVSGLKQQEQGLNVNPHGLVHWAYKGDGEKLQQIQAHFSDMRSSPVNRRSKISNQIRRHFKGQGAFSWSRLSSKK
ncbi:DUF4157 domain-containing protein [Janthinobacterium sp. GW458P]|uniref:eCIS core domain-containing protein n=1 Tax=Janthinobacterium sp. GW458P TaxID=1981504 RepID=UPI001D01BF3C|nr:DUF4157 domain-containing protein [Janthinobacterium sp. GW458P]